jgi:hypothetical protein
MKRAGFVFCLMTLAAALPALAGDEVGNSARMIRGSYPRYEVERPKTPQEARRAALERANDQFLFGIPQDGGKARGAAPQGGSEGSPALVVAANDFWNATLTLGGLTLGFVATYFPLVFWGVVALVAACGAIGRRFR